MAVILHIETATRVCSVALSVNGKVHETRESSEKNAHSSQVTLFIEDVMKSAGLAFPDLDAVAVSMGPGSYTGLRIGVSTAKGICFAVDRPLIAINTLHSMAAGMKFEMESQFTNEAPTLLPVLYCPMIDARRMEVYCGLYDHRLNPWREIKAEIITTESFRDELATNMIIFAGDGADKCRPLLGGHENATFLENYQLSATYMAGLAEVKYNRQEFENVAYFEPFYLKDFIPGIPKVKGLND